MWENLFDLIDSSEETGELANHIEIDFSHGSACYIGSLRCGKGVLLAIAFYDDGVIRLVHDESGRLQPQEPIVFKEHSDVVKDRQEASHPHATYPLESGDEFLVPDLGADAIFKVSHSGV